MKIKLIITYILLFAGIANAGDAAVKRTDYKSTRTGMNITSANENFAKQMINTMSKISDISQMKYMFNANRWKPTQQNIIDLLKGNKTLLESINPSQLQKLIPDFDGVVGITDDQITIFVNSNYDKIFL